MLVELLQDEGVWMRVYYRMKGARVRLLYGEGGVLVRLL